MCSQKQDMDAVTLTHFKLCGMQFCAEATQNRDSLLIKIKEVSVTVDMKQEISRHRGVLRKHHNTGR